MQERYIAAADLGSSKIALSVAKVEGKQLQVIYYKETPSAGIFYSYVRNPKKASILLKEAVKSAEDELDIKIEQIVLGLPRYYVRQEKASASIERSDDSACITAEEIDLLKDEAKESFPLDPSSKEVIFGAVAQSFSADEDLVRANEEDVIGVPAEVLEGNFKIFIGAQKSVNNLNVMLKEAGLTSSRSCFTPISVSKAVLTDTEKENGVALIELGAGVSSLTIYKDNILRHYSSIPFGAHTITTDIKYECSFDIQLCENIKLAYGACMPEKLQSLSEKVLQIHKSDTGIPENLTVKYLSEIITCRVKEIISAILYQIQESGYSDSLRSGVVITGGGAELVNLSVLIKSMSGYNVRIGYPRAQLFNAFGCPGATNPSAAASIGMLLEASEDPYLNCAAEGEHPISEAVHSKSNGEQENHEQETLFTDEETVVQKSEEDSAKTVKPGAGKKSGIRWRVEKVINETIGSLFDQMGTN